MNNRVRDWGRYKHFKDRNAPWIKLNKDLLSSRDWFDLPADTARALVMLWLVASEDPEREGNLPDERELAFRLRMTVAEIRDHMGRLGKWLEQTDTGMEATVPETLHIDNREIAQERQIHITDDAVSSKAADMPSHKKVNGRYQYSEDFERFWVLYPKNQRKNNASKVFEEIVVTVPAAEIIAGLQRQLASSHFTENPKHFTNAQNWLQHRRWEKEASR